MVHTSTTAVAVLAPYDLGLSVLVANRFARAKGTAHLPLRFALRAGGRAVVVQVVQTSPSRLKASFPLGIPRGAVQRTVSSVVSAALDLRPFYRLAGRSPVFRPLLRRLRGVKPLRPPGLFEMAITALTEQQISLAAAYAIRSRLVQRFGQKVEDSWAFPEARALARATKAQLRACGLSGAKAEYVQGLARSVQEGRVDFDAIAQLSDAEAHQALLRIRGFGPWSADYVLVRGLGRVDAVPWDDVAVRSAVGQALGEGQRVSAAQAQALLQPFRPYRGLAAFYLLASRKTDASG